MKTEKQQIGGDYFILMIISTMIGLALLIISTLSSKLFIALFSIPFLIMEWICLFKMGDDKIMVKKELIIMVDGKGGSLEL